MVIKLIKAIAPYIWVGFWLWVFMIIAGEALEKAPLYFSIPIVVVIIAFTTAWLLALTSKKRDNNKAN